MGKFYPQAGSPQNWFCRRRDRVFKYSANIESTIYLFCNKKDFERGWGREHNYKVQFYKSNQAKTAKNWLKFKCAPTVVSLTSRREYYRMSGEQQGKGVHLVFYFMHFPIHKINKLLPFDTIRKEQKR